MIKKPVAIISAGYWFRIAVPVDKLSDIVNLLSGATRVDSAWVNDKNVWYKAENQTNLSIEIVDEILDAKPEEKKQEEEKAA